MNKNIFREYDIRGEYKKDIDENVAYTIGLSYGSILQEKYDKKVCTVGMDNRLSSTSLHASLIKGLNDTGLDVIDLGLCTTPMFFYGCIKTNTLGIMVTASHNPKDDNGFKFSFDDLGNARGKQVYDFRDYTLANNFLTGHGKITKLNIYPYYKSLIKENIHMGSRKLKVVIDPGNGTTCPFAKDIYSMFDNLDITMINDISDATFPNHHPDPAVKENLVQLQNKVLEIKADIGISYDGDGDRVGFVDNNGQIITTDKFMVIVLRHYFPTIDNKKTLYDVKCSKIVAEEAKKLHGEAILCRTGASYTRPEIKKQNIPFGGEFSGHYVFNDCWPGFDSGLYSGLRMLEILSKTDKQVNELLEGITPYYNTPEIKLPTDDDIKFNVVEEVKKYCIDKNYEIIDLDGIRINYPNGWALIRASNTGPNLTLRFEFDNEKSLNDTQKEFLDLIDIIKAKLG